MTDRTGARTASDVASHPVTAIAGLLASLGVLAWTMSSSYFHSDDFLNFARASELGFRAWVNGELFGHWLPARKALDWGLNAARPISWPMAVAILIMFVGVAALLTRLTVLRLTRSGAWANVALVLLPLSAAIPGTMQWYAGAAQVVPALACAAGVILGIIWLPAVRGRARMLVLAGIAGSLGVGLLFDERTAVSAIVAPALLPLVTRGRALRSSLVISYALVVPVLAVWYLVQSRLTSSSGSGSVIDLSTSAVFILKAVVQNALPALFGWVTRPALWSEDSLWVIGVLLAGLLTTLVLRARSRVRAAWALGVWLLAAALTAAPTAIVRAGEFGVSAALEPRYLAMAMPFGTIALVYVLSLGRPLGRKGVVAAISVTLLLAVGAALSLANLHTYPLGKPTRAWATQLSETAAAQDVAHFYNTVVPPYIIPAAFYPYNLTAAVLPQLLPGSDTIVTTPTAGLVQSDGTVEVVSPTPVGRATLVDAEGFDVMPPVGEEGCFVAGSSGGRLSYDAPAVPTDQGVIVISVLGGFTETGMRLVTGPNWDELRDKTAGVGGHPPVAGSSRWVTTEERLDMAVLGIDVEPDQSICIAAVEVGVLPKTD